MRLASTFLDTRFGRRLFLLFAGCALLPIAGLALVSYVSVNRELQQQAESRLADTSKSLVMGVWERLAILDAELQIVLSRVETMRQIEQVRARSVVGEELGNRFRGIILTGEVARPEILLGATANLPELTPPEVGHLETGRPLLKIVGETSGPKRLLLVRSSEVDKTRGPLIWGEIEPSYLWWGAGQETTLPAGNELVVLDAGRGAQLYSTLGRSRVLPPAVIASIARGSHDDLGWLEREVEYLGHYRFMNLRPAFHYPGLTLVVGEPRELAALPLAAFKRSFLAVALATTVLVLLLSSQQIRSSLVPLEKLHSGTRRVADGDFGVQVSVESKDEFGELAGSFNTMACSLERQFETLRSLNDLQQTVLSALKIDRMVHTVLEQFARVFPCESVSVSVMNPDRAGAGLIYHQTPSTIQGADVDLIELSALEVEALEANRHHLVIDLAHDIPTFMPRDTGRQVKAVVGFPAFLDEDLAAVIAASIGDPDAVSERDFAAARQVTDQVAIGLANTRLIHELDNLNWSTLSALARAIDVRSPWTMGHTERVTRLARQVGQAMNLSKDRLDCLHRGGLLHDIGKIGVRSEVLDKSGPLSSEELAEVREHVRLGTRIIEPIPALADAIPVVLQHHEWFNGEGYPAGLAGDEICLEARILTIADCYDALRSERPYRGALSHEEVMDRIRGQAGTQFDPKIVEVFCDVVAKNGPPRRFGSEVAARVMTQDLAS